MRFLLLSDTHGRLGIVNQLARAVGADAVIHAGDFGFYDEASYDRLSDRELRLHVAHAGLDARTVDNILGLPRDHNEPRGLPRLSTTGNVGRHATTGENSHEIKPISIDTMKIRHVM